MATDKSNYPPGAFVIGTAINDFEYRPITTQKGKKIAFLEGLILAGGKVVKVTQSLTENEDYARVKAGQEVSCPLVPHFADDGIIKVNASVSLA